MTRPPWIKPFAQRDAGFTLIEIIMVIVLLAIIGSGILLYFAGVSTAPDRTVLTQAAMLATEKMETIRADAKANGFNSIVAEAPATLGAPFDHFTREVEVICVDEADLDTSVGVMPACAASDIGAKRVRVVLSWAGGLSDYVMVITDH